VQPTYFWPSDGSAALARVALLDRGRIRSGVTIVDAIGGAPLAVIDTVAAPGTLPGFRARAAALYDQMRAAMRRGDWPAFGRAYDALGALLQSEPRGPTKP
jgi:hypothetical protein